MDYVIRNSSKNVYLKLNENGSPETCSKCSAQRFEHSKAKNILDHLPKTLKRYHFCVESVGEIQESTIEISVETVPEKKVLSNENYTIPESVLVWQQRVTDCNGLAKDAAKRKEELVQELSNIDKDLSNVLHTIEMENWKNGVEGYKTYKTAKIVLEKRREIKDELIVVSSILDSNLSSMASDRISKVIGGLSNRKFTFREVD